MRNELNTFKITISHRQHGKDDPTPWQADLYLANGKDFHAIAETPAKALVELAAFWESRDPESASQ